MTESQDWFQCLDSFFAKNQVKDNKPLSIEGEKNNSLTRKYVTYQLPESTISYDDIVIEEFESDDIVKLWDLEVFHKSRHLKGRRNKINIQRIGDMIVIDGQVLLVSDDPAYVELDHPLKDIVDGLDINKSYLNIIVDDTDMNNSEVATELYFHGKIILPEKYIDKNGLYIKFRIEIVR